MRIYLTHKLMNELEYFLENVWETNHLIKYHPSLIFIHNI